MCQRAYNVSYYFSLIYDLGTHVDGDKNIFVRYQFYFKVFAKELCKTTYLLGGKIKNFWWRSVFEK